ncbi:sugar-binding transcriptional regulator [Lacticaseibacillus manihotivorans]|jgi:DNA-binding transcriptional regulator LsrR (DeoR family)|uniref:Transcription regulator n=2 Tax=Lacticaseibacillus manihotivorans TaxID=88233 RepID=A0A0R1R2T9_9LACO|nr:sugar-binding transcriptional regulator [Lacticaseibacillus manihotivorans]KRL51004.1 transcription regulator [Lacticaseibacillus manihotivorans DSM 13343 = JCM 12514]QFQ90129.1 sugar-binding transcriptional regulator [Lacticaseibacillus manihotivorans]
MMHDERLLTRVAYQYYIQNQTQSQIAKNLNIGRSTISRLLTQARQRHIVSISINTNDADLLDLEAQLKRRYHLRNVDLINSDHADLDLALAQEAAQYLKQIIKPNNLVGISWGSSLALMVGQLDHPKAANATFVPLVGGPSAANAKYHVNTIVYDLARKFMGNSVFINATAVQESSYLRDGIMNAKYFQELARDWAHLDIALVGVGGPLTRRTTSRWRDLLTPDDRDMLKDQHAIGDCCCTFYDVNGKLLAPNLQKRTIAIPLETLKQTPIRIAVARSTEKVPSIKALLQIGVVNTLITDADTASQLLN